MVGRSSTMPARAARICKASGNSTPSSCFTNSKTSPPRPQPKQCQICLVGETMKDGVFSWWNGQSPRKFAPDFLSFTYSPTKSTTLSLVLISSDGSIYFNFAYKKQCSYSFLCTVQW